MPSSSSLLSLVAKFSKAVLPSPLPQIAAPRSRCFSVQATKGKGKPAPAKPLPTKGKEKPDAAAAAAAAEKKPKKTTPQAVYKVSSGLSGVLQISETTRPDAVKRLWDYIKAHNLQSAADKKQIVCDSTLKKAFGQDNLTFSEVLKVISPHLTRKV